MTNIMRITKKVLIILLIMQIIFAIPNISRAEDRIEIDDIINSADNFLNQGKEEASDGQIVKDIGDGKTTTIGLPSSSALKEALEDIYNILMPLAIAITVIVGGVLGINFMLASTEDKAKIKESLVPYVVGCIVIYGAFGIWKVFIIAFSQL